MSSKMRWRYGDTEPNIFAVDAARVVEIGDLCYLATDDVRPASAQTDQTSLAKNQREFKRLFTGVAMQQHRAADAAGNIRLATQAVVTFDCANATFEIGDLVGPAVNGGANGIENQKVIAVTSEDLAIGRCAKRVSVAATTVLVDIDASTTMEYPRGLGYRIGQGGAVTQATNKSTGATLNKVCGKVTMNNAALAADAIVSFTLTNSFITPDDLLILNHTSGGTVGSYVLNAQCGDGSAVVTVANRSAGSLGEAIVIGFVVVRAPSA